MAGEFVSKAQIAQRVAKVLLQFPGAAIGGVKWSILMNKYKEAHTAPLDVTGLGHATPLAAATALLFDDLRLVDGQDESDPVVAVEDGVALSARPGCMGTWPSMYRALCKLVAERGAMKEAEATHPLLLSQLGPHLQREWHADFDEAGLSYLTEEGAVHISNMEDLVQTILQWRELRLQWRAAEGKKPSAVDRVIESTLVLVDCQGDVELRLADDVADLAQLQANGPDLVRAISAAKLQSLQGLSLSQNSSTAKAEPPAALFKDAATDTFELEEELGPLVPSEPADQVEGTPSTKASTPTSTERATCGQCQAGPARCEVGTSPKDAAKPHGGDRRAVPSGIVERLRAQIEAKAKQ